MKTESDNGELQELLTLQAIRKQAQRVLEAASDGQLVNFEYDAEKMADVADYVMDIIVRDFGPDKFDHIPPHGRWQHFEVGGVPRVERLLARWEDEECTDPLELTRRLIDLFFVSVLLDAGAGDQWRFQEPGTENLYSRSEGIAVASLYMFAAGSFSSDEANPDSVDAQGLIRLDAAKFQRYFHISERNPLVGVDSRVTLLNTIGKELSKHPTYFGVNGRPGNVVDFLTRSSNPPKPLDVEVLWSILQQLLIPAWPKNRTRANDQPVGDAWPLQVLARLPERQGDSDITRKIQPFHKLTQWLAYSLMVPFARILGLTWTHGELLTGLPEYRNGGLFVDLKVLRLKPSVLEEGLLATREDGIPLFNASSDVVVEWRAMTVALLDELHKVVSSRMSSKGFELSMAQMLEAGTWKSGRELAAKHRPSTKSSPILVEGDGTLF